MLKSGASAITYLYGLQYRGMKFGLRNIAALLREAGNPEQQFPSIHVAGTNGKGSTAAFLASIATEAGYRTALYTSPHLIRFTERIRINGREISEQQLIRYVRKLRPAIDSTGATFFEATTCIAFLYFADAHVDLAVIETGLGGRLDATNVLQPLVSVITNVSYDHKEYLGNTISSIAKEKAGIIKKDTPCVTGSTETSVLRILRNTAAKHGATFHEARKLVRQKVLRNDDGMFVVNFSSTHFDIDHASIGMRGAHQVENARLALASIEVLSRYAKAWSHVRRISTASVLRGLQQVRKNTGLCGRFDIVDGGKGRSYILDVAHNPAGMQTLIDSLPTGSGGNLISVFGVLKDKEYRPMLRDLARVSRVIVPVTPSGTRALPATKIYRILRKQGIRVRLGGTVGKGIAKAHAMAGNPGYILITGSHYVVGEALEYLSGTKKA